MPLSKATAASVETSLWTPDYLALLSANLLICLGFYMLPSTLPAYVKGIGGDQLQVSLVIGSFSIMSLMARFISGPIVDEIGEKRVIIAGVAIIVATTLAFIWMPVNGILLLRSVQGLGWGVATVAIASAVFKVVPQARRGEGSGYYVLTVITSLSVTPVIAILLMRATSYAVMLGASALLTLTTILLLNRALVAIPPPANHHQPTRKISWRNVFEPKAFLPSFLCFIVSMPLSAVMSFLVLFGQEQRIDEIWIFFVGYTLMILVTRPFIGRLFDRRGHAIIILPGCLAMMVGLAVLSVTGQSLFMLVLASLFYGLGYGAVHPSLQAWAVNRSPVDRKAAANGLYLSGIDLGYLIGTLVLGFIAERESFARMYLYSIITLVVFLGIYLKELAKERSAKATRIVPGK